MNACPNGLAFAGSKRGVVGPCDYPHRVGCPDGTRVMGQKPIGTDNCSWLYGVFPHATSCTRYWHCWNGTATIQQCPFSLLYNDALHACDWPDNVPDCQKHLTKVGAAICKDTPNGPVAIEKSCVRYWLCVGGYPRLQRCPAGLAFNPNDRRCELAQTVPGWSVEPPPTTPAPEDDEESSSGPQNSNSNSRPPQGPLPAQFRPSQAGARNVGK
ncbi:peritrophin-like protein [Leptotrombidium deliense]|uniref:Peritrophin-like protein n=1 Tax=Leptotrombidium deliense TaxID=299467 RepID=A0A443SWH5_9ACAR|nr:peritrophin-like protein [Leptotrombidium deliense]